MKSVSFPIALEPVIQHDMGSVPTQVNVIDINGVLHYVDWTPIDLNSIALHFTEVIAGKCNMTFQS